MASRKLLSAALTGAAALTLASCDAIDRALDRIERAAGEPAGAEPGAVEVADVPTAEPGTDRAQWRAISEKARTTTGNLTASLPAGRSGPLVLAFGNGLTYELQQLGIQNAADVTVGGGDTFAAAMDADPRAGVYIYRVVNERVDSVAPEGGLCGKTARATFVAISEYVTTEGDWAFKVGAFSGVAQPGPAADGDPGYCAAYSYALS